MGVDSLADHESGTRRMMHGQVHGVNAALSRDYSIDEGSVPNTPN